mgnify:CR=1 FL=1
MTTTWTIETAASALEETETYREADELMSRISEETGWPIVQKCLVPQPRIWHAFDGYAKVVGEYDSAREAAQDYLDGGDFGQDKESITIEVRVWRTGIDVHGDEVEIGSRLIEVTAHPEPPDCAASEE